MNIRGEKFDITDIRFGHESDSAATWYLGEHMDKIKQENPAIVACDAFGEGAEFGIKLIASYLKEYGITIELHDKEIPTHGPDTWYSGLIIKH